MYKNITLLFKFFSEECVYLALTFCFMFLLFKNLWFVNLNLVLQLRWLTFFHLSLSEMDILITLYVHENYFYLLFLFFYFVEINIFYNLFWVKKMIARLDIYLIWVKLIWLFSELVIVAVSFRYPKIGT